MQVFLNTKKNKDLFPIAVQLGNGCGEQVFTVEAAKELSKKLAQLVAENFTSTNNAGDVICPHWEIYNRGGSGEFGTCNCGGKIGSGQTAPGA
jgi:hypothetical protein